MSDADRQTPAYRTAYEISALRCAVREYRDALTIACDPAWPADTKRRLIAQAVRRAVDALGRADTIAGYHYSGAVASPFTKP